jgi:hypothetical protein
LGDWLQHIDSTGSACINYPDLAVIQGIALFESWLRELNDRGPFQLQGTRDDSP